LGLQHWVWWQTLLVQSAPTLHPAPSPHLGQLPPQSVPVSLPFLIPSLHETAAQWLPTQWADVQSELAEQAFEMSHLAQLPPQSTSVSLPSTTPFPHEVPRQMPA
jgi:hypothetical protein